MTLVNSLSHASSIDDLLLRIARKRSWAERLALLEREESVRLCLEKRSDLLSLQSSLSPLDRFLFLSLIWIGQGERVFPLGAPILEVDFRALLDALKSIESFYKEIGGVIGYHKLCLELIHEKEGKKKRGRYHPPKGINIDQDSVEVRQAQLKALQQLDQVAEFYPLGGAADRLALRDKKTGAFLTAASMQFCRRTLLQRLIDDVQAKEFLAYRLFGKKVRIPIVIMTSPEKGNDADVRALFEEENWFGRSETDFFLMTQPLVPTMTPEGAWCTTGPSRLLLKPGGHGVLWKLARERGAFDWLAKKGAKKGLTRQINNIAAGIDGALLSFIGIGLAGDREFGFAACPRLEGVSEGINVLVEREGKVSLTNIEYCDFSSADLDESLPFLANTNLLFVDLPLMRKISETEPLPGLLVNAKPLTYQTRQGEERTETLLRLESTMQNVADSIMEPVEQIENLSRSYITTNRREKTISAIKNEGKGTKIAPQTAEKCLYDLHLCHYDLLANHCGFSLPKIGAIDHFFRDIPPFLLFYHPSLGPLYSVIGQKLRGGIVARGSELSLHISDLFIENLTLQGSLEVHAIAPMGHYEEGTLVYSTRTGKCILENVTVKNEGVDHAASDIYWRSDIVRFASCSITIEEGGEFIAQGVELAGNLQIHVPKGKKVRAEMAQGSLKLVEEELVEPTWHWDYSIESEERIKLKKREL